MSEKVEEKNMEAQKAKKNDSTLEITVLDRVSYTALFPEKSNIITLTLIQDLIDKVKLSREEMDEIELKFREGVGYQWNGNKATVKSIELSGSELAFLAEQVTKLDKAKQITRDLLPLCQKIRKLMCS